MSENAFLDYDGLSYYDEKNKSYVDSKVSEAESTLNTAIDNIVSGTTTVGKASTATYAKTSPIGTNTTQIATTAFVQTAIANLVDSAPETLNTLNELSAALGDDPNFATTVANRIGNTESNITKIIDGTTTVGKALKDVDGNVITETYATKEEIENIPTSSGGDIADTATGKNVTLTDSTNAPLVRLKVKGKTEQFTTSGKNLLNPALQSNTSNGITFTRQSDGSYTMTGTQTDTSTSSYVTLINGLKLPVGRYKLSGGVNSKIYIRLVVTTDGGNKNFYSYGEDFEFPIESENSTVGMILVVTAGTTPQGTFYPMIRKADITDGTYEPFTNGASPNPDYPQEINGLAKDGAIEVKTTRKNIFGGLALENKIVGVVSGATKNEETGSVSFSGSNIKDHILFNDFKKNTQYTFIFYGKNLGSYKALNVCIYYTDGTKKLMAFPSTDISHYVLVSDVGKTVEKLEGVFQDSTTLLYPNQCGIFEGIVTLDDFEPYTETTAAIPTDAPLYEGDYLEIFADGSGKIVKKMGSVVFDGSDDEEWNKSVEGTIYYTILNDAKYSGGDNNVNNVRGLCSHFTMLDSYYNAIIKGDGYCGFGAVSSLSKTMMGMHSSLTTVNEWKTWLQSNPVTVVYELAEPTETPLTAEQVEQFKKLYTFEPVTNVLCDGEVEIQYYKNTDSGKTLSTIHKKTINDEEIYATKTELSDKADKSTIIPNNDLAKTFNLSTKGWYRVASMGNSLNSAKGTSSNGCDITIKRSYTNNSPEVHKATLLMTFGSSTFVSTGDKSDAKLVTKIRHTVDTVNNKSYLEIYYDGTKQNTIYLTINNGRSLPELYWKPNEPVATQETVEGVDVYSTLNFAYNSKGTATYDGEGNVISDTYAAKSHGTHVSYGTATSALGTSSAGTATTVSRSDHVHALPALTSCSGTLTVAKGGTGATTAAGALTNLGLTATATELNYCDGVTSNIQTQLNGKAASSHGTHVSYSTTAPLVAGTGAVGTATTVSRSDHVHPAQTTVSGNAGSATKWETARNINGMSVDGSANRFNYGTCSTAAATVAKTVSCTGFTLATGAEITVKFTVTNTASNPTLNVNSTGAKAIYYRGSTITAGYLAANRTYTFRYNGTQYELVGDINVDTNTDTKVNTTLATTTKAYLLGTSTTPTSTAQAVTTVSDTGVYLDTTAGQLVATKFKGALVGNADTATKATQDGSGNNIVNTYAKKSSVLSTVAQCEASTTSTDIAGASALSELNTNSLKYKYIEFQTIPSAYSGALGGYRSVIDITNLAPSDGNIKAIIFNRCCQASDANRIGTASIGSSFFQVIVNASTTDTYNISATILYT